MNTSVSEMYLFIIAGAYLFKIYINSIRKQHRTRQLQTLKFVLYGSIQQRRHLECFI